MRLPHIRLYSDKINPHTSLDLTRTLFLISINIFNQTQHNLVLNHNNRILHLFSANFDCTVKKSGIPLVTEYHLHSFLAIKFITVPHREINLVLNNNIRNECSDSWVLYDSILNVDWTSIFIKIWYKFYSRYFLKKLKKLELRSIEILKHSLGDDEFNSSAIHLTYWFSWLGTISVYSFIVYHYH